MTTVTVAAQIIQLVQARAECPVCGHCVSKSYVNGHFAGTDTNGCVHLQDGRVELPDGEIGLRFAVE